MYSVIIFIYEKYVKALDQMLVSSPEACDQVQKQSCTESMSRPPFSKPMLHIAEEMVKIA
jgi:hypothetical protein